MSAPFAKTPGWLDWYQDPSTPRFALPPGAVDAHCHVFGPGAEFPYAPERKYTPCDASREQLFALRDHLGISRNVIVQATCHGADNSAMVDAVRAADGRARGIATVRPDVTEAELRRLDEAGVRGVRFNFVKRLVSAAPKEDLATIAKKIAPLGWHVVIYFEGADLEELEGFFDFPAHPAGGGPHGTPGRDPARRRSRVQPLPAVRRARRRVGQGQLPGTAQRHRTRRARRRTEPLHRRRALRPAGDRGVPGSVLWGTDWPHPNLTDAHARRRAARRLRAAVAVTAEQQHKLLVANPTRLYWPGDDA